MTSSDFEDLKELVKTRIRLDLMDKHPQCIISLQLHNSFKFFVDQKIKQYMNDQEFKEYINKYDLKKLVINEEIERYINKKN
jgi:hypothetical protein